MKLSYLKIDRSYDSYEKYLHLVSEKRKNCIMQLADEKKRMLSIFTEMLIRFNIVQYLDIPYSEIHFCYGKYGKPYLLNYADYHFSVSHSEDCIVYVSDQHPIGIDVEQIKKCNFLVARRCFTSRENNFISNSADQNKAFFQIWTSKEAYVKMSGIGLTKSLKSFDVFSQKLDCHISSICLDDYMVSICSKNLINTDIMVENIYVSSMLQNVFDRFNK